VDKKVDKNFSWIAVSGSFTVRGVSANTDFKSVAYTIPPPGRGLGLPWSNCGMKWGAWQERSQFNRKVPPPVEPTAFAHEDRLFGRQF
jgi:hypothetical protein